jgi:hypothetical protein
MATNRARLQRESGDSGISGHVAQLQFSQVDLNRGIAIFRLQPSDGTTAPEIVVPLSQIRPNTVEDRQELWGDLVRAMFAQFRSDKTLPEFVMGFEVQTGEDSTGDPALYVRILVRPTRGPADEATVSRWSEVTERFQEALLRFRLQRWPYVQIEEWRRKR